MKKLLFILLGGAFLAVALLEQSLAQQDTLYCGTTYDPKDPEQQIDPTQFGGIYLTSEGVLRVLVVFVSFPDDNNAHPWWPVGQPLMVSSTGLIPT